MDDQHNHDEQEVVDGEVLAEFHDHTLMNLPSVPEEDEWSDDDPQPPSLEQDEFKLARRRFLLRLAVGGASALAVGGSAALLLNQNQGGPTVMILPNGSEVGVDAATTDVAALFERISTLEYDLAKVTAERDQLLTVINSGDSEYAKLLEKLAAAEVENEELRRINEMWADMDSLDLDQILTGGLSMVGGALTVFMGVLGLLQSGLAKGQSVISQFIIALTNPKAGMSWLQSKISRLSADLDWLSEQVQEVVEAAEPFTTKIAEFVLWILDRLPFGAGDKARAGMDAMETVVNSLPEIVDGMASKIYDPLADWFGDDNEVSIHGVLLDPVQENLVTPARDTLDEFTTFQTTYQDQLATPVEEVLEARAALRVQIQQAEARLGLRA